MTRTILALTAAASATALLATGPAAAQGRDQIRIVGSSTVYPFATTVAERFGQNTQHPAPIIESTGSGGGFQLFCEGVGLDHPDISNASRAITESEVELCRRNGVEEITEVNFGKDGIVLATSLDSEAFNITRARLWQALAATTVGPDGAIVENPYETWAQIDPSLPDTEITVFGPPPTSGTRDAFVELAMEEGCMTFEAVQQLDDERQEQVCARMREDGGYVNAGENDNLIVQRLNEQPGTYGLFGFSFLDQNRDVIQGVSINDFEPTFENIASGDYPLSRPLFFYVKNAHIGVVPGLMEYVQTFLSPEAIGPDGYLIEQGLIPLTEEQREQVRQQVSQLQQ
jgi:phosphate transport system substrate-binding protein